MKRKINYLIAAAMVLTVILFACHREYDDEILVTEVILTTNDGETTATLNVGEALRLKATISPEDATYPTLIWASRNEAIATVSSNGTVTAKSAGTVTITATTEDGSDITATFVIIVNALASGITLNPPTLQMVEGETKTLTATVLPTNANQTVTWTSSRPNVATVANGVVSALIPGTTTIIVTTQDGSKTATCEVTVSAATIPVTDVTLNLDKITLIACETCDVVSKGTLVATVWPNDATNKNVTWVSSDTKVATVSTNGVVTAVIPSGVVPNSPTTGHATITVKTNDGNKTATCDVTVNYSVTNITLLPPQDKLNLTVGNSIQLIPEIYPIYATNQTVNWDSSDKSIATVANNGLVTAIAPGKASIVATTQDGGRTAISEVTVTPNTVPVILVTLSSPTLTLVEGRSEQLFATISPSNATNQAVTWSSSNTAIATVDPNGNVTAVASGLGKAIITVTTVEGNRTATCEVTVNPKIDVTGISLNRTTSPSPFEVDDSFNLKATIAPSTATNKNVNWGISSGNTVVTITKTGDDSVSVKAITSGTAIIVVTTEDGGFSETCTITVN